MTEQDPSGRLWDLAQRLADDLTGSAECRCEDVTEGDGYFSKTCAVHRLFEAFLQAHSYLQKGAAR